jgi:RNA polymerase sigma factor (sigma-70 family)
MLRSAHSPLQSLTPGRNNAAMSSIRSERSVWLGRHVLPHEPALRAWLRRRRLDTLEIDDVIQETYTRLVAAPDIAHIRDPRSYAFQIAGSVVLDHLRRMKVVSISSVPNLDALGIGSGEPSPERQVIDRDELARLAVTISAMPARIRDVLIMRRIHGLTQREVAKRLTLSESTVEKHMAKAFLLMSGLLRHGGNDGGHPSKSEPREHRTRTRHAKDRSKD